MDFSDLFRSLQGTLGEALPRIAAGVLILLAGWLVALVVRAVVRRGLGLARVNERLSDADDEKTLDVEGGVAKGAYYLVLLLALVAFFNVLDLQLVSAPLAALVQKVLEYLPNLVAGGVLALVAWLLATVVRRLATAALGATTLDEKLALEGDPDATAPSASLGNVLYWLVILLLLPAILGALQLTGLLGPVQAMVDKILALVPNVLAAVVIGAAGWFVARLLRDLVKNLLSAAGFDRLGERIGLKGKLKASELTGLVVYIFVLVPALIAALNALKIQAISEPATQMLASFMSAVPNIFAAAVILALAWFAARLVSELVVNLLGGLGFDSLPESMGLAGAFPEDKAGPSALAGRVVAFFIVLFAVVEAAGRLGFGQVSDLVATFVAFGAQVLQGVVIIAVGFWLSNLARAAVIRVSGKKAATTASIARFAILGLVFAMGLRAMGLADDIINLAFGLTLGAVAVAAALSFGLGGREAAGKQMEHWLAQLRGS